MPDFGGGAAERVLEDKHNLSGAWGTGLAAGGRGAGPLNFWGLKTPQDRMKLREN